MQLVGAQPKTTEDEEVKRLRTASERGDNIAQMLLAERLQAGRGVHEDVPQSVKWIRDACLSE
jgi:TPR repeat protein